MYCAVDWWWMSACNMKCHVKSKYLNVAGLSVEAATTTTSEAAAATTAETKTPAATTAASAAATTAETAAIR